MATKTLENTRGIETLSSDSLIFQICEPVSAGKNFNVRGHDSLKNAQATKQRILENIDYIRDNLKMIVKYTARCFKVPHEDYGIAFRIK